MSRYIVTIYYITPMGNPGSYRWENQANNHDEALFRAKNTLYNNGRHKVGKILSGDAYLVQKKRLDSSNKSAILTASTKEI